MTVRTADADSLAALALEQTYKVFVDLACKHHLNDIRSFLIGYTQTVDKLAFLADFAEHFGNFGAAAVDKHNLDANL